MRGCVDTHAHLLHTYTHAHTRIGGDFQSRPDTPSRLSLLPHDAFGHHHFWKSFCGQVRLGSSSNDLPLGETPVNTINALRRIKESLCSTNLGVPQRSDHVTYDPGNTFHRILLTKPLPTTRPPSVGFGSIKHAPGGLGIDLGRDSWGSDPSLLQ